MNNQPFQIPVGLALQALQTLQKMSSANFPAMDAFRIAKLTAMLSANPDVLAADKTRLALFQKYGEEKDGRITIPSPARQIEFAAEFGPVAEQQITLSLALLPLSILEHAPEMTPGEMQALSTFLTEDTGAAPTTKE